MLTCLQGERIRAVVQIKLETKVRLLGSWVILQNAVQILLHFTAFTRLLFSVIIVQGKLGEIFCRMTLVQKQTLLSQVLCTTGGYVEKLICHILTAGRAVIISYRGPERYLLNSDHTTEIWKHVLKIEYNVTLHLLLYV